MIFQLSLNVHCWMIFNCVGLYTNWVGGPYSIELQHFYKFSWFIEVKVNPIHAIISYSSFCQWRIKLLLEEGKSSLSVQSHLMNSEDKLEIDRFAGYLIFDRIWSCLTEFLAWGGKLLVGMEEKYCWRSLLWSDISDLLTFKENPEPHLDKLGKNCQALQKFTCPFPLCFLSLIFWYLQCCIWSFLEVSCPHA